jgi:cytochrome c oxidase subunit 4
MPVQEHHVHVSPLSTYYKVFGSLLFLTVVTVGVSYAGLPSTLSIIVAMIVACVKASLVCAWFMHLKYDTKFNLMAFGSAIWFVSLLFIFTTIDLGSRGTVLAPQENFVLPMDQVAWAGGDAPEKGAVAPVEEEAAAPVDEAAAAPAEEAGASDFDAAGIYTANCSTCHGDAGDGQGPAGAALSPTPADFSDAAFWERSDADVAKAIKGGGMAVGKSPIMPPFAQFDDAQIDALIAYLKTFNKG